MYPVDVIDIHEPLLWSWCGDEGSAALVGPFHSEKDRLDNLARSTCDHDHAAVNLSPSAVARSIRDPEVYELDGWIFSCNRQKAFVIRPYGWGVDPSPVAKVIVQLVRERESACTQ